MVWRIRKVEKNEKMGWNGMRKMSIPNKGLMIKRNLSQQLKHDISLAT